MKIGLISDTHGLLRPAVFDHFAGVEHILHAGDVGQVELLLALEALAPVTAVWGNTDSLELRAHVPETAVVELEGRRIRVVHGHQLGQPTPAGLRAAYPDSEIIVFGHTHRPVVDRGEGRLVVNPGAAGPARFNLRPSLGILTLTPTAAEVEIIEL
jgi:putative phosphoesterase